MTIRLRAVRAGIISGLVALGAAELAAAAFGPQSSPVVVVGGAAIDLTPTPLKKFAVATFGTYDKAVLIGGVLAVLLAVAGLLGLLARRHPWPAAAGVSCLGLLGVAAALTRPAGGPLDAAPSLVAAVTGAATLLVLSERLLNGRVHAGERGDVAGGRGDVGGRRDALIALGVAAGTAVAGRLLTRPPATTLTLPRPAGPARPLPAGVDPRVPGLGPFTTPRADFYRVDTALVIPRVDPSTWTLRVHGSRTVELTMSDLLRRGLLERDITLSCVSNEVGGPYVGHARWLGVPLATLLREAGIPAGADQLLSRSADGWTCGTPLEVVTDGRDAMVAVGMDGAPLPAEHGFPARLVVPGLYGYASATKWVVELKATTFAAEQSYWVRRGWAVRGPIKTMSRIDVPAPLKRLAAGPVTVAGVAWAQHTGIAGVEVRADGGPWQEAVLAAVPGPDTWRLWSWTWQTTPGTHRLEVRATDAAGHTQQPTRTPPFPSGATGWHSVVVTVR